jgi:hypothetical protein
MVGKICERPTNNFKMFLEFVLEIIWGSVWQKHKMRK